MNKQTILMIPILFIALVSVGYVGHSFGYSFGYSSGLSVGFNKGFDSGYIEGYNSGNSSGFELGFQMGNSSGYGLGFKNGNISGYELGFKNGNLSGYNLGYDQGLSKGNAVGYGLGYSAGNSSGYDLGYKNGYLKGVVDGAGRGFTIRDPTYQEMLTFINLDKTDWNAYSSNYNCLNFAADVKNNAFLEGYRCGFVYIEFPKTAHSIVCFNTTDRGLIFVEPQDDELVILVIGQSYATLNGYLTPDYDDRIIRYIIIW